ncbi:MAG TPA: arginine--tRNA ligase [Prolixibacteraceae bacterium]|nr:arginine--tRNA ligase [Prolixibacteraceae bacterium]
MDLLTILKDKTRDGFQELFGFTPEPSQLEFQQTRKPYEGDLTLVVFPFVRFTRKSPEETARMIGEYLTTHLDEVTGFNVAKGFLNFSIADQYWLQLFEEIFSTENFGLIPETADSELVMVEYSSPNTNKPLHLGHIRNNLLGYSLSRILKGNGKKVVMTNIVNDRGIHICKSMYAWLQRGNGETPESSGIKGDHLVGKYYVKFDEQYKEEIKSLIAKGLTQEEAEKQAPAMLAVREMLRKWEAHDPETISLWKMMNSWVYNGFDITYRNLGVSFDKIYYESDTYLHGKEEVLRGVKEGTFQQMEDGSVWADLTGEGLDRKVLLRSDGTSVYMTQDIGTAQMRFKDFPIDKMVYVVGNEQNYHFQVLSILLDKLGYKWGKDLYHFSYGMVELPSGKMKSREGTVVDADDLMEDMFQVARKMGEELGKLEGLSAEEADKTYRIIALGALKYFILKVDPKKNMMFNPEESIDFNGNTGPFIQYTHARICSVLRKAAEAGITVSGEFSGDISLNDKEKELIKTISQFPEAVREAGRLYSPALLANYCYDLVKLFNQFYHDHSILNEADLLHRDLRLALSATLIQVLKNGMGMLGIELPERM